MQNILWNKRKPHTHTHCFVYEDILLAHTKYMHISCTSITLETAIKKNSTGLSFYRFLVKLKFGSDEKQNKQLNEKYKYSNKKEKTDNRIKGGVQVDGNQLVIYCYLIINIKSYVFSITFLMLLVLQHIYFLPSWKGLQKGNNLFKLNCTPHLEPTWKILPDVACIEYCHM